MTTIIKFGPKNKHITIPEGYTIIKEGVCQENDRFLVVNDGTFRNILPHFKDFIGDSAEEFECLIRANKK